MLGWWITLLVMATAYRLFYVSPPAGLTNEAMEAWLTEAGMGLRQGFVLLRKRVISALESRRAAAAPEAEESGLDIVPPPDPGKPPQTGRPPDESP